MQTESKISRLRFHEQRIDVIASNGPGTKQNTSEEALPVDAASLTTWQAWALALAWPWPWPWALGLGLDPGPGPGQAWPWPWPFTAGPQDP